MTDSRPPSGSGPSVCPFVALAEDRDRRADAPDEGNRCYAERAPRRRDLVFQSEYCYTPGFAGCSVFLAWAARSAAEPAYVSEAAQKAWGSGITAPETQPAGMTLALGEEPLEPPSAPDETLPSPSPEGGLFGPAETEPEEVKASEQLDWVSAAAWAEAPWDERAEMEAEELEALDVEEELVAEAGDTERAEEATQAPKVPAALPMRRRKPPQEPIRSRGSGEWVYADPPGREPLVSRRSNVTPTILLAVLGVLVVSIVVFLIAAGLGGSGGQTPAASPSPAATLAVVATAAPATTAQPSVEPSPTPEPKARYYRVKAGDSLTSIAAKFDVKPQHLQCLNGIINKNIVVLDARYQIPPEGFSCPSGWRKATPAP